MVRKIEKIWQQQERRVGDSENAPLKTANGYFDMVG